MRVSKRNYRAKRARIKKTKIQEICLKKIKQFTIILLVKNKFWNFNNLLMIITFILDNNKRILSSNQMNTISRRRFHNNKYNNSNF